MIEGLSLNQALVLALVDSLPSPFSIADAEKVIQECGFLPGKRSVQNWLIELETLGYLRTRQEESVWRTWRDVTKEGREKAATVRARFRTVSYRRRAA